MVSLTSALAFIAAGVGAAQTNAGTSVEGVATTAGAPDTTEPASSGTTATEPASSGTIATPESIGEIELDRPLKVTSIGYANEIALLWAVEKGLFEPYGLEVERVPVGGGSAAIAAVTTGAVDLGFTNGLSAIQAYAQGFPIQIVLGAYENAYPTDPETGRAAIANVDSGVTEPCDLEGKKVGVTELGNIGYQYWIAWLRDQGCNIEDVNFVTIPAGQIVAALESGRIDAIETGGNAVQDLVNRGVAVRIGDPMGETSGRVEYAMYIANNDFIAENPKTLAAFRAAMNESLAQINDPANEEEWLQIAADFSGSTPELIASSQMEKLDTVVDLPLLQNMVQVLVDNGTLPEEIDVSGLIYSP
jgi:NitT/TauT family transport system substrate-binding protein